MNAFWLRALMLGAWCLAAMAFESRPAVAQRNTARPPPPAEFALTTKDGVQLKITYYAGTDGRETVPVILLHDFNETRAVMDGLAVELQDPRLADEGLAEEGPPTQDVRPRAVVTVDLRGHGESKTAFNADGSSEELDANRFQQADFEDMVHLDMEAVRSFLVDQNDAGTLNLNELCVVGAGMGANVAVLWAAKDWATPPLAMRKQSQDVKALVLISPRWTFHGLSMAAPLKFPPIQRQLSIFLAYGAADRDVAEDGRKIEKILERFHPEPPPDQVQEKKDYFAFAPDTVLQGTELLNGRGFGLIPNVAGFVEARLGRVTFPYVKRKN